MGALGGNMDYIFSFILGLLTYSIHVLLKYNEAKNKTMKLSKRRRKHFSFISYLENNITRLSISLLAYIALFILLARIGPLSMTIGTLVIGKAGFLYVFSFMAGYSSDSIFRNLIKATNKNWDSVIGGNNDKK